MRTPDPFARWQAVERWLAIADLDRRTVEVCLAAEPPLSESAALHCQQAAEKLLKGFLVLAAKRFRKTHSLTDLAAATTARFPDIAELAKAVQNWSDRVFVFR